MADETIRVAGSAYGPAVVRNPGDLDDLPKDVRRDIERTLQAERHSDQDFNDSLDALSPDDPLDADVALQKVQDARDQALDVLQGLRQIQGAEDVRWRIYRAGEEDGKKNGWLAEIPTPQLTYQWIVNKFGGGTYRCRGYDAAGRYRIQRTLYIAEDASRKVPDSMTAQVSTPGFNMSEFMAHQQALDAERRREAAEERERNRRERNEMIALLGPILAPIAAALLGNRGPDVATLVAALKPPPPPDPVQQLVALRELDHRPKEIDPIDRAFKVMELMQDRMPASGGEESGSWVRDLIRALAPALPEIVKNLPKSAPAQPAASGAPLVPPPIPVGATAAASVPARLPAPSVAPSSVSAAGGASSPPSASSEEEAMNLQLLALLPWFKAQVDVLLKRAARAADPALAADAFMMDFPEDVDAHVLLPLLSEQQWWPLLQRFDARVSDHREWFASFHRALTQLVQELQQEAQQNPSAPATVAPSAQQPALASAPSPAEVQRPSGPPILFGEPT